MSRSFFVVVIPIALSACLPLPGGRSLSSLTVADKQGTSTLVATDGSSCEVAEQVFREAQIGSAQTCVWKRHDGEAGTRRGGRLPTPVRPPRIGTSGAA